MAWYEGGKRRRKFFAEPSRRPPDTRGWSRRRSRTKSGKALSLRPVGRAHLRRGRTAGTGAGWASRSILRCAKSVAARKVVGEYPLLQALQFWKRHHDDAIATSAWPTSSVN